MFQPRLVQTLRVRFQNPSWIVSSSAAEIVVPCPLDFCQQLLKTLGWRIKPRRSKQERNKYRVKETRVGQSKGKNGDQSKFNVSSVQQRNGRRQTQIHKAKLWNGIPPEIRKKDPSVPLARPWKKTHISLHSVVIRDIYVLWINF